VLSLYKDNLAILKTKIKKEVKMKIAPFFQQNSTLAPLVLRTLKEKFLNEFEITDPFLPHEVYMDSGSQKERLLKENPDLCLIFLEGTNEPTRRQADELNMALEDFLPGNPILWVTVESLSKQFDFLESPPRSQLINIKEAINPWLMLEQAIRDTESH